MPRVPYVCDPKAYCEHYGRGLPTFQGDILQEGYGIGSFLSNLFRSFIPLAKKHIVPALKRTATAAGKSLLRSGANVAKDVILERKDIRNSLKRHGKQSVDDLLEHVGQELNNRQKGSGYKAPCKKRRKAPKNKKNTSKSSSRDIFA